MTCNPKQNRFATKAKKREEEEEEKSIDNATTCFTYNTHKQCQVLTPSKTKTLSLTYTTNAPHPKPKPKHPQARNSSRKATSKGFGKQHSSFPLLLTRRQHSHSPARPPANKRECAKNTRLDYRHLIKSAFFLKRHNFFSSHQNYWIQRHYYVVEAQASMTQVVLLLLLLLLVRNVRNSASALCVCV
jgi:hypothetical protein